MPPRSACRFRFASVILAESALPAGDFHHQPRAEDEAVAEAPVADQPVQLIVDVDELEHGTYTSMLLTGRLNTHLDEIERSANELLERVIARMAKSEGVTEALKASGQMAWVGKMNNIRHRAEEIVLSDLIYA